MKADPAALGSGARDTGVGNEARGAPEPPEAERTRDAAHAVAPVGCACGSVGEINLFCRATPARRTAPSAEVAAYRLLGLGYGWFLLLCFQKCREGRMRGGNRYE